MSKKYQIIYADPPWMYNDKMVGNKGVQNKYTVQSDDWIKNIGSKIKLISDENCALFIWITFPKLPIIFDVIKSWGFEYKTIGFVWIKKNKLKNSNFWGLGNYTRSNSEICLLATKGRVKRLNKSVHSVVESKIRSHSQKPDEVKELIIKLFGDLPRIELFARNRSTGWDSFGNEIESDITL